MTQSEAAQEALRAFGCDERLVSLLDGLAPEVPVYVKSDRASVEFLPVAAGPDHVAAMYCERRIFYVALDPKRAEHFVGLTQARVAEANQTTWRIAVSADAAGDSALRPQFKDGMAEALRRSADGNDSPGPTRLRPRRCTLCFVELPASGICDEHGPQA